MRRLLPVLVLLAAAAPGRAAGLLIPTEEKVPPLAMLNHLVTVSIDEQVAVTRVEQTFRNHTSQQLEATYLFPVPKGASVRKFSMWVDGKEVKGEMVEAAKAREIYQSIVQRTQDPGLLEYMGNNLLRLRVFPIPPRGDQKIMVSFTHVAPRDNNLVEYVYPLRTTGKAVETLEKFSLNVEIKSQHAVQNVYSPSHAITMTRPNDRHAKVTFAKEQAVLDKDFQLFYGLGDKDVGLTTLTHRPVTSADGYFMLLLSPRVEISRDRLVPRDMVFVLDTSGSMRGKRMTQARNALKYCLKNLSPKDRFAIINFATTVNRYSDNLLPADEEQLARAAKWVDELEATGGTAINDALLAALSMRPGEMTRTFNVIFFTDGRPTIGETDAQKIQQNVLARNNAATRIFTFGVGDDVNATLLDQLAEHSKALSTYVRETEDIEVKVSGLYSKISNPVLTNLKLTVGDNVKLSEVYPPQLPDLFHGTQLVVMGRYKGEGHVAIKLTGSVGNETREFVHEISFPAKTNDDREFVEDLWARRKVGYLLDQIRLNGEKKELIDEVVSLAKRYGIATPYTSYLIVPDAPVPVAGRKPTPKGPHGKPDVKFHFDVNSGPGLAPALDNGAGKKPTSVTSFIQNVGQGYGGGFGAAGGTGGAYTTPMGGNYGFGGLGGFRGGYNAGQFQTLPAGVSKDDQDLRRAQETRDRWASQAAGYFNLKKGDRAAVQEGKLGVDLSCETNNLRSQERLSQSAVRRVGTRNALEVGGVWIDEAFDTKMKTVAVKAQSAAYFRILERHAAAKQAFALGNHVVWVTPSNVALVIDTTEGAETMSDADIDRLFVPAGKKQ